jgi:hypothetical protein
VHRARCGGYRARSAVACRRPIAGRRGRRLPGCRSGRGDHRPTGRRWNSCRRKRGCRVEVRPVVLRSAANDGIGRRLRHQPILKSEVWYSLEMPSIVRHECKVIREGHRSDHQVHWILRSRVAFQPSSQPSKFFCAVSSKSSRPTSLRSSVIPVKIGVALSTM